MAKCILVRRDTTANWLAVNPVLGNGELGVEILTSGSRKVKIGDGTARWRALPYLIEPVDLSGINSSVSTLTQALATETTARQQADNAEAAARQAADNLLEELVQNIKDYFQNKFDYLFERLAQWIPDDLTTETGLSLTAENDLPLIEESREAWRREGRFEYLLDRLNQWIPNDIGTETGLLILAENNHILTEETRNTWRMEE